ncbi:hypothetical protein EJ06DRAFT_555018 [Trichodelitschia bisporula]|uniref:Uncharacterized protein n=1 Tax=Trichodelitschia bisporula TaxID=703511 RepID=A0A6G1I261_9PEZI|nr:hypothetical protein EJ06DRAFT_555018 [Trichodelitschia bisporula]
MHFMLKVLPDFLRRHILRKAYHAEMRDWKKHLERYDQVMTECVDPMHWPDGEGMDMEALRERMQEEHLLAYTKHLERMETFMNWD